MTAEPENTLHHLSDEHAVCQQFEESWRSRKAPRIERFIASIDEPTRSKRLRQLIELEIRLRKESHDAVDRKEYLDRFDSDRQLVNAAFASLDSSVNSKASTMVAPDADGDRNESGAAGSASTDEPDRAMEIIDQIGRYKVDRLLGKGGFGHVYLARDETLGRSVAIKIPFRSVASDLTGTDSYLTEARTVAELDHPHIVPVYDVGTTMEDSCFIVSKYIEGEDLAQRMATEAISFQDAARIVASVAQAVDYAHAKKIVHRDLKPANILLDEDGRVYVTDFGLALREENFGENPGRLMGTPCYMSPEQARGEGHLVDGRSDIFALGAILYELLTGERSFDGASWREIVERIVATDARPPRQLDRRIPKELERVCLKAMSRRAADRYSTAADMAEDLTEFGRSSDESDQPRSGSRSERTGLPSSSDSDHGSLTIVPKGLRAFGSEDADFFLSLLPGPRDREGLPDSIRFWKLRMEGKKNEADFRVGLIYGCSGCGKSSLVKAGLIPRLATSVVPIYLEATAEGTESQLLQGLHRVCDLPADLGLVESMEAVRLGRALDGGRRVCLFIDQFEQWLHAHGNDVNAELLRALRQCDGVRLQCVILVRDDFWLAVSRFFRDLEIRLEEGKNVALADLFGQDHAQRVLTLFGQAFGKLPEDRSELTQPQHAFLEAAVEGLSDQGKVISVRLALFAEMMKSRPWTPSSLEEVGGTRGIGANFLEETFSSKAASPEHRFHQNAARAVLKALMPAAGTDIKGEMKSHDELLEISGYGRRPREFNDLTRILDGEVRLITPTDPEAHASDPEPQPDDRSESRGQYYQLTHDYLVPSLRDWLTRKQLETRRGRAELRLAERSSLWTAKKENRHLPSWWENLSLRMLTDRNRWTDPQRKTMQAAGRFHALRSLVGLGVLLAVVGVGVAWRGRIKAEQASTRVASMLIAPPGVMEFATDHVGPLKPHVIRQLRQVLQDVDRLEAEEEGETKSLNLCLALAYLDVEPVQVDRLTSALETAPSAQAQSILKALRRDPARALVSLRQAFESSDLETKARIASLLLSFGETQPAESMLALGPNPAERVALIRAIPLWHGEMTGLAAQLREVDQSSFRSGVCCALAKTSVEDISTSERDALVDVLQELYRSDADPGVHSASDSALRKWKVAPKSLLDLASPKPNAVRIQAAERKVDSLKRKFAEQRQIPPYFVDLQPYATQRLDEQFGHEYSTNNLSGLPKGEQLFLDFPFVIGDGFIQLGSSALPDRPEKVTGIQVRKRLKNLFFFHATQFGSGLISDDVGEYVIHYEDGTSVTVPIRMALDVRDWWTTTETKESYLVVFPDANPFAKSLGQTVGLYMSIWTNPHPEKEITTVDMVSLMEGNVGPFCVAMTGSESDIGDTFNALQLAELERSRANAFWDASVGPITMLYVPHAEPYLMSDREISLAMFREFVEASGHAWPGPKERLAPTPHHPVNSVSWFDAVAFCNWLSEKHNLPKCYKLNDEGKWTYVKEADGYRLPKQAEWEFACCAGTTTAFCSGDVAETLLDYSVFRTDAPEPVGSRLPNGWGIFDMHGNVWEWCQDDFFVIASSSESGVIRGGSFAEDSHVWLRSDARDFALERDSRPKGTGFRIVRSVR